jgi:hypothetical protein
MTIPQNRHETVDSAVQTVDLVDIEFEAFMGVIKTSIHEVVDAVCQQGGWGDDHGDPEPLDR